MFWLAEVTEGESCDSSELYAFLLFLVSFEAANIEERLGLDGQWLCSQYRRDNALASRRAPACGLNPRCLG